MPIFKRFVDSQRRHTEVSTPHCPNKLQLDQFVERACLNRELDVGQIDQRAISAACRCVERLKRLDLFVGHDAIAPYPAYLSRRLGFCSMVRRSSSLTPSLI